MTVIDERVRLSALTVGKIFEYGLGSFLAQIGSTDHGLYLICFLWFFMEIIYTFLCNS